MLAIVGVPSTALIMIRPIASVFDVRRSLVPALRRVPDRVGRVAAGDDPAGHVGLPVRPLVWLGFRGEHRTAGEATLTAPKHGMTSAAFVRTLVLDPLENGAHHVAQRGRSGGPSRPAVHRPRRRSRVRRRNSIAARAGDYYRAERHWHFARSIEANLMTMAISTPGLDRSAVALCVRLEFAPAALMPLRLAAGAEVDLVAYLCSRQFGTRSYSAIYGLL